MHTAIELEGVSKRFGEVHAVRGLDLRVPRGAVYGFIGPNGAGKTTVIRMVVSILLPDEGRLAVLGRASAFDAKDRIGYQPEERGLYRKMRAGAFLAYMARLKSVKPHEIQRRVDASLACVGLEDVARARCDELSKGMQQKLQFAAATIHEPDLLILDEPFSGLDPVSARLLRTLIADEHRRGATILFSTHVMSHAEDVCEHIVMLHQGRKVLDEPLESIRRRYDARIVVLEPYDPAASLAPVTSLPEVERVVGRNGRVEIVLTRAANPHAALQRIAAVVPPVRIELARQTLEDVFLQIASSAEGRPLERVAGYKASPLG